MSNTPPAQATRMDAPTGSAEQTESILDVPEGLGPRAVPPIEGFAHLLKLALGPRQDREDSAVVLDSSPDSEALLDATPPPLAPAGKEDLAAPRAEETASRAKPAKGGVPPRGVFSLRNSAALLSRSPAAKAGEREVERAGWDAGAYPYDAQAQEVRNELDEAERILDEISRADSDGTNDNTSARGRQTGTRPAEPSVEEVTPTKPPAAAAALSGSSTSSTAATAVPAGAPGSASQAVVTVVEYEEDHTESHVVRRSAAEVSGSAASENDSESMVCVYASGDAPATDSWGELRPPGASRATSKSCEHVARVVEEETSTCTDRKMLTIRVAASTATSPQPTKLRDRGTAGRELPLAVEDVTCAEQEKSGRAGSSARRDGSQGRATSGKRRRVPGTYSDPTASWTSHTSATPPEEESPSERRHREELESWQRRSRRVSVGEFHLSTAERNAATEERLRDRQESAFEVAAKEEQAVKKQMEETYKISRRASKHATPKGFDAIAEEGRRKRQQRERAERERRLAEENAFTYTPSISPMAQQRKKAQSDGATSAEKAVESYLLASSEWAQKREQHLAAVERKIRAEEKAERKRGYVNNVSRSLAARRSSQQQANGSGEAATQSIYERLNSEAKDRVERHKKLEKKYTPSFQPETTELVTPTKTHDSGASTTTPVADATPTAEGEESPVADATPSAVEEHKSASREHRENYFIELYNRTVEYQANVDKKLERQRKAECAAESPSRETRSKEEIATYVALMEERENKRKQKLQQKVQRQAEAQDESRKHSEEQSFLSANSAALADRGRERRRLLDERKRREKEERLAREEADKANNRSPNVAKTAPARSAAFETHEMLSEEKRKRNLEKLRTQLRQEEMKECTFKPKVCRASVSMAEHSRLSYMAEWVNADADALATRDAESMQGSSIAYGSVTRPLSLSAPQDARASVSMQSRTKELSPVGTHRTGPDTDNSPVPHKPQAHGAAPRNGAASCSAISAEPVPHGVEPLTHEIVNLEQVLQQWRQLESDIAA